jgi:hypothetical protein
MSSSLEIVASKADTRSQLLYFTCSSLTSDHRHLVFVREIDGNPNLWARELETGREWQLTRNAEGILHGYVYFRGTPHKGFSKASVNLDSIRGIAYYIQGDDICCVDLKGRVRVINRIPAGQVTAFTHVSADGRRLCVPTTDERALQEDAPPPQMGENLVGGKRNEIISDKPSYDIDARVQAENLSSHIHVYDTQSGRELACEKVERAWITHVQFSPVNPDLICYNNEWPSDCGIRRLWLWDGRRHLRLRTAENGRSKADWSCHEMWTVDGRHIIYHGKFADGTAYVGRVSPQGGDNIEIALPREYTRYGHFTASTVRNNWLVSDGYYHPRGEPESGTWGGDWLSIQKIDWEKRKIEWLPLCRHESAWDCQDSHPHPIFSPGDAYVYFTTNKGGVRSVARVKVP